MPSSTSVWKCGVRFRAEPKRWMKVTNPDCSLRIPKSFRARRRWSANTERRKARRTSLVSLAFQAQR